jgi:hypothetical protein
VKYLLALILPSDLPKDRFQSFSDPARVKSHYWVPASKAIVGKYKQCQYKAFNRLDWLVGWSKALSLVLLKQLFQVLCALIVGESYV